MGAILYIFFIVFSVLLVFGIFALVRNWKAKKKFQNLLRDEKARSKFAEARRVLFNYTLDQTISSKDELFQELYASNTSLMNEKGNYREIGLHILSVFRDINQSQNRSQDTSGKSQLNDAYKKVLIMTVDGYGYIAFNYSFLLRSLIKIAKLFTGDDAADLKILMSLRKVSSEAKKKAELQRGVEDMKSQLRLC